MKYAMLPLNSPPDAKDEVLTLSWDTDLDTRVFDQMKK